MGESIQNHWDTVYKTKSPDQVSWTQDIPLTSLDFIHSFNLPKTAKIVDIGGGDSKLVDYLIAEGFTDITVLDISTEALEKVKKRLGKNATKVKWIVSDVNEFHPETSFDIWHDRATFHFLTTPKQIKKYIETASKAVKGYLTIGTFSETGPDNCSGLPIKKYSEATLNNELQKEFQKVKCLTEDHVTPFQTRQNFLFCSFKKQS
jgi:trans-aconitate methyltransferase